MVYLKRFDAVNYIKNYKLYKELYKEKYMQILIFPFFVLFLHDIILIYMLLVRIDRI